MSTPQGPVGGAQPDRPHLRSVAAGPDQPTSLEDLLSTVAKGDQTAFAALYDRVGSQVYGLVRRVVRDPSQSEEVTQEVLLEVWRSASRFDRGRGSASGWIMTMAHRRAVDSVRSEQASRNRDERIATRDAGEEAFDVVVEDVESRLEQQQVRQALSELTDLQRQAI